MTNDERDELRARCESVAYDTNPMCIEEQLAQFRRIRELADKELQEMASTPEEGSR